MDDGAVRMVLMVVGGRRRGGGGGEGRGHRHERGHEHEHGDDCGDKGVKGRRRPSLNAYERMPKSSVKRDLKR